MAKTDPKFTAFNLRYRDYAAKCSNVNVRRSNPNNHEPVQETDLTINLLGIAPEDLGQCQLAKHAFVKRNNLQGNVEELTDGKKPPDVQAINGSYKPAGEDASGYDVTFIPVKPPPIEKSEDDKQDDLDLSPALETVELDLKPFTLRPRSIDLVEVTSSKMATEMDPLVDLKLSMKGFPVAEAGRTVPLPWLLLEHFKVQIEPQSL